MSKYVLPYGKNRRFGFAFKTGPNDTTPMNPADTVVEIADGKVAKASVVDDGKRVLIETVATDDGAGWNVGSTTGKLYSPTTFAEGTQNPLEYNFTIEALAELPDHIEADDGTVEDKAALTQ